MYSGPNRRMMQSQRPLDAELRELHGTSYSILREVVL